MLGPAATIVFYDGVCGLCSRLVQFVLAHERDRHLRFAALQGDFARAALCRHGKSSDELDTVYLLQTHPDGAEQLFARSGAILRILAELGGAWRVGSALAGRLPIRLLDFVYDRVARHRYRWFGKHENCFVPRPQDRDRFI